MLLCTMKRLLFTLSLSVFLLGLAPKFAFASACYADPVYQYSGTGTLKSSAYMRSEACTASTMILRTLSAGTKVNVIGFTDGWYEVSSGGKVGWIGQQFLTNSAVATGVSWPTYPDYRTNPPSASDPVTTPSTEALYTGTIASRDLIKLACVSSAGPNDPCKAVYYVGMDGKRHAYPNSRVFFSWYSNFDAVRVVNLEKMGQYTLGMNAVYRPGQRMVKFTTDPKVYVVSDGGVLHWVKTEALARAYYGIDWNTKVDDIADAFYTNYTFGTDIEVEADYSPTAEMASSVTLD